MGKHLHISLKAQDKDVFFLENNRNSTTSYELKVESSNMPGTKTLTLFLRKGTDTQIFSKVTVLP